MEPKPKPIFNKRIFWDVNFEKLDFDLMANFVIERVFERGDLDDIRQFRRYYGDEKVTSALLNAKFLPEHRIHLASAVIDKPLNDFRCYILRQLNPGLFSLLKRLMTLTSLQPFSLVGGTALHLAYTKKSHSDACYQYSKCHYLFC